MYVSTLLTPFIPPSPSPAPDGVHKSVLCVCISIAALQIGSSVPSFQIPHCCYLVVSKSVRPHGLQPAGFLCPWDSLGKSTGVGCHALLQGIVPDPGIGPGSPALQADYLPLSSILALKIPWTEEPGGPQSRGSQRVRDG